MLNRLYTVLSATPNEILLEFCDETHAIFKAHFPGNPIVPGYAFIDIIAEVLGDDIVHIQKCKFISHVLPHDIVTCMVQRNEKKRSIKVFKETQKISEIHYEVR